jgi:hypothetical protein
MTLPCPHEGRSVPGDEGLRYEDFKDVVRQAAEQRVTQGSLVSLPELRRGCLGLERATFDDYVLALHRDGLVHLMSHVDPETLSEEVRRDCLRPPSGPLLYWLRWL